MERRAKQKNREDAVTATKAMKSNDGANDCLAAGTSALKGTLMERVLSRRNLQYAWEQVKANR